MERRLEVLKDQRTKLGSLTEADLADIDIEEGVEEALEAISLDTEEEILELEEIIAVARQAEFQHPDVKVETLLDMLIHSPQPWAEWRDDKRYFEENIQVWKALEDAYTAGKVKAIGVSNFLIDDLENLIAHCKIKPMVNQLLIHIGNTPTALIDFCKQQNIAVEAYSPIAHGEALKNETIVAMAQKYEVSVPQLCIKYVLNLGTIALPKTANAEHMQNNASLDFEISDEDMEALKVLNFKDYGKYSFFPVFSGK